MKAALWLFIGFLTFSSAVRADVAPVAVRTPAAQAWIGQRVPFFIDLRAPGSFAGTARFDLPQLPGVMLMKIGSPLVSSEDIEGTSWFVQTHEFALFSQKPGLLEVPAFPVRFAAREGFTGPANEVQAQVPGWKVQVQRPPGSENIGFLITTKALDVTESWEPPPGPTQVGAMFKRTIVQRAPQISGMALAPAPAPATAPDGIRVYRGDAQTQDHLERGDFLGERRDTLTYLMQKPGALALPALTYVWWNPKTETLQSKTLPAVTFAVAPAPATATQEQIRIARHVWPWLPAMVLIVGLGAWQRRRLVGWGRRCWKTLNPPDRVAARQLLRACRRHDAAAAAAAWTAWRNTQDSAFLPGRELRSAVLGLQRHRFGPTPALAWRGDELARAFGEYLAAAKAHATHKPALLLPGLNP